MGIMTLCAPSYGEEKGAYTNYFAVELDYILFSRANSGNEPLVTESPLNNPVIGTKALVHDMGFTSGLTGAIKLFQNVHATWEGRYTGGFAWKGTKLRDSMGNLNIAGPFATETQDYNSASHVKSIFNSNMHTIEFSYIRHVTPRYSDYFSASWLAGLRYLEINEKIKLYFTETASGVQTSRYRTRTANRGWGVQLGGNLEYNPYSFLTWGLMVKTAGLYSREKQRTQMLDQNNSLVFRDVHVSRSVFTYLGQFYPYIEFRPYKWLFLHLNYQVLYVGNVALAARNVKFKGSLNHLDHKGHIVYHGTTAGIQLNF